MAANKIILKCKECGKKHTLNPNSKASPPFYKCFNFEGKNRIYRDTGYYNVCKTCINTMCIKDDGEFDLDAFKDLLKDYFDKPFYQEIFDFALKRAKTVNGIIGLYFKDLNLNKSEETWDKEDKKPIEIKHELVHSSKWYGDYTEEDIAYLDAYYDGLNKDFKIITTNHKDYAKKIAQASLAVNKAYKEALSGEPNAFKRYKDAQAIFDTLSKSAQFSESSRSSDDVGISGISQVVEKIENKQWIYETEEFEEDMLDHLLEQFKNIKKSL